MLFLRHFPNLSQLQLLTHVLNVEHCKLSDHFDRAVLHDYFKLCSGHLAIVSVTLVPTAATVIFVAIIVVVSV